MPAERDPRSRPATPTAGEESGAPAEPSRLLRLWRRVPSPVRAVLAGLVVFAVVQNGWYALFLTNLRVSPRLPWSVPLGLAWLGLCLLWLGGRGWPASTAARRRRGLRARRPTGVQWVWSGVFAVLLLVVLVSVVQTGYRFQVVPEDPSGLSALPWWTLYPALVMISLTAGVSEEAGFRGYLQGGLERRYGPAVAIAVTSLVFWLVHFNHPSGAARWAVLLTMSVLLGALVWCADSVWPAVAAHAFVDTVSFVAAAAEPPFPLFQQPPQLADTGVDAPFVVFALLLLASGAGAVYALRRIRAARPTG